MVTGAAAAAYAAELDALAAALVAWRRPGGRRGGRAAGSNNGLAARCGRRVRVSQAACQAGVPLSSGAIFC
jgi:hypothetical protein